jgi:hypothetical protein
MLNNE